MLTCTDAELEAILNPDEVIAAIRSAFADGFSKVQMPNRLHLEMDTGTQLMMPCAIAGESVWGIKIVTVLREAGPKGRVRATYLLLDDRSQIIATFEANYLTDLRTAATSAIATDLLARSDVAVLGIFGTGRQAAAHVAMLSRIRPFQRVLVAGSSLRKGDAFAGRMRERYRVDIVATDALTCASTSDVICTCTSSSEPLFPGDAVRAGTHLNLIGSFQPHVREVDSVLIRRSRVFVDLRQAGFAEAGEILIPIEAGEINREHVVGDLHELVIGSKPGRKSREDITVFKSVGCALEDLVTARLAMRALQRNEESA